MNQNKFIKKTQTNNNLLENFFKPEKIVKNNSDVMKKYEELIESKKTEKIILPQQLNNTQLNNKNVIVITNAPYKNIIKNTVVPNKIESSKDLIVHKVSNEDKKGLMDALTLLKNNINNLNEKNKEVYAPEKLYKHKEEFDARTIYIKNIVSDISTQTDLKEETIEYLKNLQLEQESKKKQKDDILKSMRELEIFTNNELL